MNDPGLEDSLQTSYETVEQSAKDKMQTTRTGSIQGKGVRAAFRRELQQDEEEEELGYFQANRWWFTSTVFPLVAGTFGPLANFFSICALSQPWRQHTSDGTGIQDPLWLNAITGLQLGLSLIANGLLLANFGHVLRYSIAQPLTIGLWYLSAILLIIPLGMTHTTLVLSNVSYEMTPAYYYALISACIYVVLATLLLLNALGAYKFHAYPASFDPLTVPQRTLMLQTTAYVMYLAAGAGVFARIEGWNYLDGVYWADYTLLTIGLGSDFPPKTHAGRALLIPFAAGGIMLIGLVIGSVRGLVLERGKVKILRRAVAKERQKWVKKMDEPNQGWKRQEWEVMRRIQKRAETTHKYMALASSLTAYFLLWFLGALVFFFCETAQSWTYFEALYFSYTSLTTIGYGDFFPKSNSGKPFFVVWSIMAVPTVTIVISNIGDILVGWVRGGLMWTVLPTRSGSGAAVDDEPEVKDGETTGGGGGGDADANLRQMGTDVEHLGHAVEEAEVKRGQEGGLGARLAREVSRLARDATEKPGLEYAWDEWERWLKLLGEQTEGQKESEAKTERRRSRRQSTRSEETRGEWTWLGEDGPLLSGVSENQWMLEKLCLRLEEVLKEEIGQSQH